MPSIGLRVAATLAEKGSNRTLARIRPGSGSKAKEHRVWGNAEEEKKLSISPVQSKRLRAALAAAIPMDEVDIAHAGRSILEVGAFKRAIAAYVLYRLGYTTASKFLSKTTI